MYGMLIFICIVALIVLVLDIWIVRKEENTLLRTVCILLFIFSMTRYITLIVYGDSPSLALLQNLRYFYFATAIGLTIPTAAALWRISPYINQKLSYGKYLLAFTPWILFYLYVIIMQPTRIVQGQSYGYDLILTGKFPLYLSIAQGSFVSIMLILCIIGIIKYKNEMLRSKYLIIMAVQILLTIDGLGYWMPVVRTFPPFTVTEVFGFLAIAYAFYDRDSR